MIKLNNIAHKPNCLSKQNIRDFHIIYITVYSVGLHFALPSVAYILPVGSTVLCYDNKVESNIT